ncbi:MAG TPA: tripartite tricarboxylate transporter substrate binding protein [Burkholderiales bacterium]|nr:tripartite tricarboxylate transporter substrate binding protein [Burkholderiales bacterium]
MTRFLVAMLLAAACAGQVGIAAAQAWPSRPLRIVVPYPPGGGTDVVARTIAQKLAETIGQSAIVDNRGGANGIIGTDLVAKAKPDGYTVLVTIASHSINSTLYSKLPYDSEKDLAPVSLLAEYPFVLTVHPSLPAKSLKEFIAMGRARPDQLAYASSGMGSGPHLGMELLLMTANIRMTHIPYKGAGQVMADHVSGQVPVFLNNFLAGMPMLKAGKLRALAVTSPQRSSVMPELPAASEVVPGYTVTGWYGMWLPAGTPAPILNALHDGTVKALRSKEVSDRLSGEAAVIRATTPAQFSEFLAREEKKWAGVIKKTQLRFDSY